MGQQRPEQAVFNHLGRWNRAAVRNPHSQGFSGDLRRPDPDVVIDATWLRRDATPLHIPGLSGPLPRRELRDGGSAKRAVDRAVGWGCRVLVDFVWSAVLGLVVVVVVVRAPGAGLISATREPAVGNSAGRGSARPSLPRAFHSFQQAAPDKTGSHSAEWVGGGIGRVWVP